MPRPGRFTPGKRPDIHFTWIWVGPGSGLDGCGKSRPPPGFDLRTVQSVASHYTVYAISAVKFSKCFWITLNYFRRSTCDSQWISVIDCDKIIIARTPDVAKSVVPVLFELLLMHGNVRCVMPVGGIQTLFDRWESATPHGNTQCRSPTNPWEHSPTNMP